jgi:iron complex transport system substrate-binding protein
VRVASLLPSATEMVHFTGAGENLVGVTHECDYPSGVQNLPKLTSSKIHNSMTSAEIDAAIGKYLTDTGSIYALDVDLLAELSPDLILTQGLCDVCAVSMNLETKEKIAALRERLARVEEAVAGLPRPRVGCIEWLDPPFSAGHWVPEMVRLAGGEELYSGPGEPSVRLSWDEVFGATPEVLVLMPCGFGVERTIREARALPEVPGWDELPAVKNGRVWAVDANSYFSRPAPRLVEGVEILTPILHPEVFLGESLPLSARRLSPR